MSLNVWAIYLCWGRVQWFSMERMTGYSDVMKAFSLMALITSINLIRVVRVWPWYMSGLPSGPSQQSTDSTKQLIIFSHNYLNYFYIQYNDSPFVDTGRKHRSTTRWSPDLWLSMCCVTKRSNSEWAVYSCLGSPDHDLCPKYRFVWKINNS